MEERHRLPGIPFPDTEKVCPDHSRLKKHNGLYTQIRLIKARKNITHLVTLLLQTQKTAFKSRKE
ncbi:hypothetical protein EFB08_22615 [Rufibacter latericius]|uniref:Uncharacterized protein n=1 Tax=Rufibacter latericius TaxID=2487040 RepID=A0A3M9M8X8_9BACT|nr:hypothetical protein EFB08_22615 [Rufibacter latericius]